MNTGYLIYQAERPRTRAEQREVDACNGELAASLTRRLQSLTASLRFLSRTHAGWPDARGHTEAPASGT